MDLRISNFENSVLKTGSKHKMCFDLSCTFLSIWTNWQQYFGGLG